MEEEENNNDLPFTLSRTTEPQEETERPFTLRPAVTEEEPAPAPAQAETPTIDRDSYNPFPLTRNPTSPLPIPRVMETERGPLDINQIVEEYGRPLVKEDFLEDERLQELVYQNLEARRGATTRGGQAATWLSGGATFGRGNLRERDFEDVFEMWQNYHRSFGVGQSVTVANDIAYSLTQDEDTIAKLGAGYLLFDAMDNAFTGEGTWRETGDALWDYARGVIVDPATILTLGIGKALSAGTQRAGALAARNTMIRAYRRMLNRGATGRAAMTTLGAAARAAPYMAPDLALNVGADIAQQGQLIRTGVQEEYNAIQTGLTAAGTMALPAIVLAVKGAGALRRGALRDTFLGAVDTEYLAAQVPTETAWEMVMQRVNRDQVIDSVDENFGRLQGNPDEFLKWGEAKLEAGELVNEAGERLTDNEVMNMFEQYFWFGNPDEASRGYFTALKDAGFVVHPSMLENNTISGVYGQAITFLSDEAAERVVREFEQATGRTLGITPTADGLAAHFITRSSEMGQGLGIRANLSRLERAGLTGREAAEAAGGLGQRSTDPERIQFSVSVYKRLLTSHLATTGANLKGFGQLVTIDTLADIFSASTYATQSAFYRTVGRDADRAAQYARQAYGSITSPFRRVASVFTPDMDMEYVDLVLSQNPEQMQRLFRDVAGDSGTNQTLADLNLDPDSRINRAIDGVTRGAQTLTLVQLQDNLTKRWAFAANLDREIARNYGVSANEFWRRSDAAIEMRGETFQGLLDRAVYRTQRQTASVNWNTLPANNSMRAVAGAIENVVNREVPGLGFIFPFTAFMNTTVATLGDLSGVNAMRRLVGAARGRTLDYADQDFGELIGKAAVGWTTVAAGVPAAVNRIQSGMSWNQEENDFGTIEDKTYDWPGSTIRLASQIIAHALVGEEIPTDPVQLAEAYARGDVTLDWSQVPEDLKREFAIQAGPGQAIRDFDGAIQTVQESLNAAFSGDEDMLQAASDAAMAVLTRPIQGATRPLDPINMAVGIARDANMNPDLRQGPEQLNQAMRYINNLLPSVSNVDDLPRRATATRGTETRIDLGRQMLGNRTSAYPNLAESMFNSAGIPSWRAVRWQGPAEVKNFMDGLAAPIFEREAIRALQNNPDYFDMTTQQKETVLANMRERVRSQVMDIMETSGTPRTLNAARRLSGANQTRVARVMNFLGYEGDISDVLQGENAFDDLTRIQYYVDNYETIFHGDLNLE